MKNMSKALQSWKWRMCKAGLTGAQLGTLAGVKGATISRYINGRIKISQEQFDKIEQILKDHGA